MPALPSDHAAGLQPIGKAEMPKRTLDHRRVFIRVRRNVVAAPVRHAKPAAQIQVADVMAFALSVPPSVQP